MATIRFGIRNMRVKTYPISYFSITKEEADKYSLEYEKLDLWNSNKNIKVNKYQIEKRVCYFHIMFVPIFSTSVDWTTRKLDGKIYFTNKPCKDKILLKLRKKKFSHWYFNLIPITSFLLILFTFFFFLGSEIISPAIKKSYYKHQAESKLQNNLESTNKLLNQKYTKNKNVLKKIDSTYFIEFQYLNSFGSNKEMLLSFSRYGKINSIRNNKISLDYLPDNIDQVNLPINELKKMFDKEKLENQTSSIDSISDLIPKNIEDAIKLKKRNKKNIVIRIQTLN